MIIQHRFKQYLGIIKQQAITWANVDPVLCLHMALLGHNVLKTWCWICASNFLFKSLMNDCIHSYMKKKFLWDDPFKWGSVILGTTHCGNPNSAFYLTSMHHTDRWTDPVMLVVVVAVAVLWWWWWVVLVVTAAADHVVDGGSGSATSWWWQGWMLVAVMGGVGGGSHGGSSSWVTVIWYFGFSLTQLTIPN